MPIVYGFRLGETISVNKPYVPWEFEDAYWRADVVSNPPNQWYCLSCHMPFFDQATGDPIYEHEDR